MRTLLWAWLGCVHATPAPPPPAAEETTLNAEDAVRAFAARTWQVPPEQVRMQALAYNLPYQAWFLPDPAAPRRMDAPQRGQVVVWLDGQIVQGPSGWAALLASPFSRDPAALAAGHLYLWQGLPLELRGLSDVPGPEPAPRWDGDAVVYVYANARGRALQVRLTPAAEPVATEQPWTAP